MPTPWWQLDWVWQATGWTLAAAGFALILWALFWDRARGRKRCPKCWYDLSGAVMEETAETSRDRQGAALSHGVLCVCSECGKRIAKQQLLLRTRRNWPRAVAALLVMGIGFQTAKYGTPGREGIHAYIPTLALLAIVPEFDDQSSPMARSLVARLQSQNVLPWDLPIVAWVELRKSQIDWKGSVAHRTKWPTTVPLRIELRMLTGASSCFEYRTTSLEWTEGDAPTAVVYSSPPHISGFVAQVPQYWIDLPAPKLGSNSYTFRATVSSQFGVSRSDVFSISVEGVPTIVDAITPVTSRDIVDEIQGQLRWSTYSRDGEAGVWVSGFERWFPDRREIAYVLKAELLRGGEVIASDVSSGAWGLAFRFPVFHKVTEEAKTEQLDLRDLTLRITGDPQKALMVLGYDHYWDGHIEMPLRDCAWQVLDRFMRPHLLDSHGLESVSFSEELQRKHTND